MKNRSISQCLIVFFLMAASMGCSATKVEEDRTMKRNEVCENSRLDVSLSIINSLLKDIGDSYDHVGGEISGIKLSATNTYIVSISQEERIDQITYTVNVKPDCSVEIVNKEVSALSPWDE